MIETIQIKRGIKANLPRLAEGELALCTDTGEIFIGTSDGNLLIGYTGSGAKISEQITAPPNANVGDLWIDTSENVYQGTVFDSLNTQLTQIAINVTSFGAKGDGITDDTAAFQAAAATGKPLLIPYTPNFYKLSGTINITNSVYFQGQVKMFGSTGNGSHMCLNITSKVVDHLVIVNPLIDNGWDGTTKTGEDDACINIQGVDNVSIIGGYLKNAMGDNIYIGATGTVSTHHITVSKVRMDNPYRCNVALTGCEDIIIEDCYMTSNSDYVSNIDIEPNTLTNPCLNITIKNNYIKTTNGTNIFTSSLGGQWIDNVKIHDNYLYATNRCYSALNYPIGKISIKGNKFDNGLEAMRLNAQFARVEFENNSIKNFTGTTIISVGMSGNALTGELIFARNKIENTSGNQQYINIQKISDLIFDGNILDKCSVSSASAVGSLSLQNIDNTLIINNVLKNNGGYAIGLDGTFKHLILKGNEYLPDMFNFTGYTKGGIQVSGTSVIKKVVSENNIYSGSISTLWLFRSGALCPPSSAEMKGVKTHYSNALPTYGTYELGDRVINTTTPATGVVTGWECSVAGTYGTLTGITGTITANTTNLAVSDTTPFASGEYVKIGPYTRKISYIDTTNKILYLTSSVSADQTGVTLTYPAPTFVNISTFA